MLAHNAPTINSNIEARFLEWQRGYRLGEAGKPVADCQTPTEARGWRDHNIASLGSSLWHMGIPAEQVDSILGIA